MVDAIRFGRSKAELAAIARPYIDNLYKKYVPVASNDAVTAMAQLVVIETEAIGSKSADACYEFLYPRPGRNTFVATDYLPREIQEHDLSTIATVIETGSASPQRIPTEEEISPLLKIVIDRLAKRYPINDIAALADPGSPTVGHEKVCSMTTALYREVLTLPAKDKLLLLRFLFAQ
jgi:hypothetical protein